MSPLSITRPSLVVLGITLSSIPCQDAARTATPQWVRTRLVSFANAEPPIAAEVSVAGEFVAFDATRFATWTDGRAGERAFAGDAWPTFDTFSTVKVGRKKLKAGSYVLSLVRGRGALELQWFAADKVLGKGLTPATLGKQRPVARVALDEKAHTESGTGVTWYLEKGNGNRDVRLRLLYGDREWSTELEVAELTEETRFQFESRGATSLRAGAATVVVDHGDPVWSGDHEQALAKLVTGQRWRLGQDWWTTLQTPTALRLGDVDVEPGLHHLAIERTAKGGFELLVMSSLDTARKKLDAAWVAQATVGARVPLVAVDGEKAGKLTMRFVDGDDGVRLEVAFGPNRFAVGVVVP